jgi:hypothetical protein
MNNSEHQCQTISNSNIKRNIRQGCPLIPYLFIIVKEIFNQLIQHIMHDNKVQGVIMPNGRSQQTISQYANDTPFTIGEHCMYILRST